MKNFIEFTVFNRQVDRKLALRGVLREVSGYSLKSVKRAIDRGACFVNGSLECLGSRLVDVGDHVFFYLDRFDNCRCDSPTILYEDDCFSVFNKPPFFACDDTYTLHRLDKETSGLIMKSDREKMFALFRQRKIEKTYLALVNGRPESESGVIKNWINEISVREGQKVMGIVDSGGKFSHTEWKICNSVNAGHFPPETTLIECKIITGLTHQIRVHLSSVGMPVAGDWHYLGDAPKQHQTLVRPKRMLLHAWKLGFIHPVTGEKVEFEAPIPIDFCI